MRTLRTALLTAAAAGLAVTALAQVPAAAAPAPAPAPPKFLSAGQLPASLTPWTAGPVRQGVPSEGSVCTAGIAPAAGTRHRDFRTELDTGARQTITVAATTARAKALAAELRSALETCLDRLKEQDPGLEGRRSTRAVWTSRRARTSTASTRRTRRSAPPTSGSTPWAATAGR